MKTLEFTQDQIDQIASTIISTSSNKILCFYGSMGAGKTTLIKALVKKLGAKDAGSSPTFGLVNEYHYPDGTALGYHFDFYRLEDENEALDFGLEDYLAQDVWIFMEWPEKITSLLPDARTNIYLKVLGSETRSIKVE